MNQPQGIAKLRMYKTAFSWVFNAFVKIESVYPDARNEPILVCKVKLPTGKDHTAYFRQQELSQFSL